ncbi:putative low affinity copper uptake protein 2 [Amphibalanus amphitrite]|uniref:Copper transport protein n=1 Tax=Amphibalanus amphitrite TaxID=1232801 RepID=A0A6A4VUY4_AMPAM|nr:putative low affinity copper uptake protein 2 [Amphibalanus amphitrite]
MCFRTKFCWISWRCTYGVDTAWFADYLRGHTQQVQIVGSSGVHVRSAAKPNSIGVFQDGSLSCILYTVFTNELSLFVPDGVRVVQFADDTQLLVSGQKSDLPRMTALMERALECVYTWFCSHGMKLNAAKTQVTCGYFLMLATMTYSSWIMMAVCAGAGVGYAIFAPMVSKRALLGAGSTDHCQ